MIKAAFFILVLLYFAKLGDASNCTSLSTCRSCIDYDTEHCYWCSADSSCIEDASKSKSCSTEQIATCEQDYYTIIFIVVLSGMICLCCGTCYLRRLQRQRGVGMSDLLSPLLPNTARNYLFRSGRDDSEHEWMCIMCGFDNKPRNKDCMMCGTSHEFTLDYKSHKKEKREIRRLKAQEIEKRKKALAEKVDIPIPEEAQITSISMSLKYGSAAPTLSPEKKIEALNYRRLNQLSLRQKSARRRKMWQRKIDETTGILTWVRVSVKETKVGGAPLGYTPRNSICVSDGIHSDDGLTSLHYNTSYNTDSQTHLKELMYAAASNNSPKSSQVGSPTTKSILKNNNNNNNNNAYGNNNAKKRHYSKDSFGDNVLVSGSPGYTSVFDEEGGLTWQQVETGRPVQKSVTRTSAIATLLNMRHSSSTSTPHDQIHELNNPISDAINYNNHNIANINNNNNNNDAENPLMRRHVYNADTLFNPNTLLNPLFDLEAVAAMIFKDKQLWFMDRMSGLQTSWSEGFVKIEVRRSHILQDTFQAISSLKLADLHKWIRIQFAGEPGVDAGGLEREWFNLVTEQILSQENGLFTFCGADSTVGAYHINPTSGEINRNHLQYFKFIGRFFGKAIMEQQSLRANLSLPLRKQMLSVPITFSDLEFVDTELYKNLLWLKNNDNVSNLMLDFSISYASLNNCTVTYNLIPNGSDIPVTDENKDEYLQLRLRHRMLDSIKPQLEHFLTGLYEVIPPELLSVFDYQELDLLMCGMTEIDITDWMKNTEYLGEYNRMGGRHPVIRWFWRAVETMTSEERIRLLQFTTGCARLPAQGFKALQSNDGKFRKFNIQSIHKSDSIYPRAHTCFNKLDLPLYDNEAELEAYLSVVINMEITGFTME